MWPFKKKPSVKQETPRYTLMECDGGNWYYHIADNGITLCGNLWVMKSPAPLDTWGYRGNAHEIYCRECDKIALERGIITGSAFKK